MSFKDKVTFSMESSADNENVNNTFIINNIRLLKSAAIYGANASGKSNLIKALTCAILMVRNSNIIQLGGKWNNIKPFMFNDKDAKEPSSFEFVFITNGIKYNYKFTADNEKVYEESLEAFYSQKPTLIFSRKNVNEYKFYTPDENKLKAIESKTIDNKLFLTTATNWNYDKTKDAYLWFMNSIDTFNSFDSISIEDIKSYSNNDNNIKEFSLKLLKEADIKIKDLHVDYEEKELDDNMINMIVQPLARTNGTPKLKNVNIELTHEIIDNKGYPHLYKLNYRDESSGTQILFTLAPFLKRAFENPRIVIVDELEKSLHPSLVEFLIKVFNNPKINKVNSQLIFTTHAVNLLDLDLFRRDQIWFTEKDDKTGATDLYALDDFSVRKTENIQKGYLNGRYGAIPFIKNDTNLWQE